MFGISLQSLILYVLHLYLCFLLGQHSNISLYLPVNVSHKVRTNPTNEIIYSETTRLVEFGRVLPS